MPTAFVYDPKFLEHDTGPGHPERPERLQAIVDRLKAVHLWDQLLHLQFGPASVAQIEPVHDRDYIGRVQRACAAGARFVDSPDSAISRASCDAALLAAGGVLAAVDAVLDQRARNAFCAVRPPGHHAERDRSMGFCLFNNVAIAAEHLLRERGLDRVAIVDFDVHHGNGTQHSFEGRSDVLFISVHEHPTFLYPGTGFAQERGLEGTAGLGYTLNLPLPPQSDDEAYREAFIRHVLPALTQFQPQFLLVSAGFDAAEHDPLAHMRVTASGFEWIARQLKKTAEQWCAGRIVSVLEGGYDLRSLSECVTVYISAMLAGEGDDALMGMKAGL